MAVETAARLGVAGLAGDLIADGAFGSRTAALARAVRRPPRHLRPRLRHRRPGPRPRRRLHRGRAPGGLPLHRRRRARGDPRGLRGGRARARRRPHPRRPGTGSSTSRCPRRAMVETMSRLGVTASVQPMFDALWGGPDGMYAERLGERWRGTNPFRALADAGVTLAFGSDSPVTPLGPWAAVRAAVHHHAEEHRLDRGDGVRGPHRWCGSWRSARPAPTSPSGTALPDLTPGTDLPRLLRTVAAGRTIHRRGRSMTHPPGASLRTRRRGPRMSTRTTGKLELDPATVKQGAAAGRQGRPPDRPARQEAHHRLRRAGHAPAGRPRRRRPRRHPLGQPARRRGPRRRRPRARRRAAGLGRAASAARPTTWPRSPRRRPPARSRSGCPRAATPPAPAAASRKAVGAGVTPDRRAAPRARAADHEGRRRPAQAVDLPDRRDRRHLRGHPAGPGRRPRGRRRDRGDPLDRPVAARLRARGRRPARASPAPTPPRRTSG